MTGERAAATTLPSARQARRGQQRRGGPAGSRSARSVAVTLVILLMLLGAGLRLLRIGRESLWIDEGYTAYLVRLTPQEYVDNVLHTVRNILPPLYFNLLHYWTALAGSSETALRLPSAVAGVLAIPVLYALVARCFDRTAGLLAATALALSLFHLRYSQEARMYELLAMLSLLSLYLLVRLVQGGGARSTVLLAVVDAAIVYTHHYGALLLIAEAAWLAGLALARDLPPGAGRRWLLSRALFAVLILPWAVIFADQVHKVSQYPWLPPTTARSIYDVLVYFAGTPWCLAALGLLVLAGLPSRRGLPGRLWARAGLTADDRGYLLLWSVAVVPVVLAFGYSVVVSPVFGQKYLIASCTALLALAALGARRLPGRVLPAVALVAALAVATPEWLHYYRDVTKEQWREATAFVDGGAAPGDLVLFNAGYGRQNGYEVYTRRSDLVAKAFPLGSDEFATLPTPTDLAGLAPLVRGHRHAWIVYEQSPDHDATIAQTLGGLSAGGECRAFVGLQVCRYDLRPAG
ncbi:MAG TPA: glycosyltransferase family 39 protein [Kineosporiaceae bacterium]|nr:glycosyltransferase family 39 protein [Kineosporiaceae bacterium]